MTTAGMIHVDDVVDLLVADARESDVARLRRLLHGIVPTEVEAYEVARLVEDELPAWPALAEFLRAQPAGADLLLDLLPRMRPAPAC